MTALDQKPSERASELLRTLSLRDKAALMFHTIATLGPIDSENPTIPELGSIQQCIEKGITHFNLHGSATSAREMARHHNDMQRLALSVNAKIPVTLSSDPRNAFSENVLSSLASGCFSQWPEPIGMAAIADEERMEAYCDIVRQEYIAVGLRGALHPQVDLATHYMWSRIGGGMGEDADLTARLTAAYVRGLQGETLGPDSVTACAKHFPGGGPQRHGYDCHMAWGAEQDYPGGNLDYHLEPFRAAITAGVRNIMPSYGKPMATEYPEVAFGFNKPIIEGVLRKQLGYQGIVLSDWLILESYPGDGDEGLAAKAWGVEHLSLEERILMSLDAGIDQFGGNVCVDALVGLVESGKVPESRIDRSALLILTDKFALGIFDKPLVDEDVADKIVGSDPFSRAGRQAQADSLTLILNERREGGGGPILPLSKGIKVYLEGFDSKTHATQWAEIVSSPDQADTIIVRLQTPWSPVGKGAFARMFHHGSLEFPKEVLDHIARLAEHAPVIIDLYTDRPAVLGSLVDSASAIICNYGVREDVLLSVLFGVSSPRGKLPFDLPRSDQAVTESKTDVAYDTKDPVFKFGHGLVYDA